MEEPGVLFLHSVGVNGKFEVETVGRYRPDLERFADKVDRNAFEVGKWHVISRAANGTFSVSVLDKSLQAELPGRKAITIAEK